MDVLTLDKLERFKNGALGVARNGLKAKFICQEDEMSTAVVVVFKGNDFRFENYSSLPYYQSNGDDDLDIISLWEDRPDPFDLERALNGEAIKHTMSNDIYYLVGKSHLDGVYYAETKRDGITVVDAFDIRILNQCYEMVKEPEPVQQSAGDLPKPIKEFGDLDTVWYVKKYEHQYKPYSSHRLHGWLDHQEQSLNSGCYYATAEDCQKVCDWLMNR